MRIIKLFFALFIFASFPFAANLKISDIPNTIIDVAPKNQNITLNPGDDIQKAIDSLSDGGKITFSAGNYDTLEAIVLNGRKDLILEGTSEVWINTKGIDHHVITLIDCHNIILDNIKMQHVILEEGDNNPVANAEDGAVLGILGGSDVSIMNCELVGCGIYGVYAKSATPILLEGCYLHNNSKSAVFMTAGAKTMYATIRDCTITKNADSIELQGDVVLSREGENLVESNSPGDYMK